MRRSCSSLLFCRESPQNMFHVRATNLTLSEHILIVQIVYWFQINKSNIKLNKISVWKSIFFLKKNSENNACICFLGRHLVLIMNLWNYKSSKTKTHKEMKAHTHSILNWILKNLHILNASILLNSQVIALYFPKWLSYSMYNSLYDFTIKMLWTDLRKCE